MKTFKQYITELNYTKSTPEYSEIKFQRGDSEEKPKHLHKYMVDKKEST